MIRQLKRRLEALEHDAQARAAMWPPVEGSMGFRLWNWLNRPEKPMGYMEMYLSRAEQFWEEQK